MNRKVVVLLECFAIFVALIVYSIRVVIPEYKEKLGSSDRFLNTNHFQNMIEIRMDSLDVALLINEEKEVYHLFFFDNSSVFLYNKNIENHSMEDSLSRMVSILIDKGVLSKETSVEIIRYGDKFYPEFRKAWEEISAQRNIPKEIVEKKISLEEKAKELGIQEDSVSSILFDMDFTSKELVKNVPLPALFTLEESIVYSDRVYEKLVEYVSQNEILSLEKGEGSLIISMIPGDYDLRYYPTKESWYQVRDKKVYAYIDWKEDGQRFSYCYQGSIDERIEGECVS